EAESIELGREDPSHPPHPFVVLRRARNIDRAAKKLDGRVLSGLDTGDDRLLLRRESFREGGKRGEGERDESEAREGFPHFSSAAERTICQGSGGTSVAAPECMATLDRRLDSALNETRILILGAQVLFGVQLDAIFQTGFDALPRHARFL